MQIQDLYDVSWRNIRQLTFGTVDTFQKMMMRREARPRDLVQGIAILLLIVCRHFKLEPRDVLETASRVLRRAKDIEPQYPRGIEAYLNAELPNE